MGHVRFSAGTQLATQPAGSAGHSTPISSMVKGKVEDPSSLANLKTTAANGTGGPGAVKPRPGVRSVALGAFLTRLRQEEI